MKKTFLPLFIVGASLNFSSYAMDNIWAAAGRGDNQTVEAMLDRRANVNVQDGVGMTPLHRAAESGRLSTANLLLARNADVFARAGFSQESTHECCKSNTCYKNHSIRTFVGSGKTPLEVAQDSAHGDVVSALNAVMRPILERERQEREREERCQVIGLLGTVGAMFIVLPIIAAIMSGNS